MSEPTTGLGQGTSGAEVCEKHGPFSRFCCACTREDVEAERDRYREALEQIWRILLTNGEQARERAYKTTDEAIHHG